MAPLDLSSVLKGYENQWVALSDDNRRVLGAGPTAKQALKAAQSKGYSDATLIFVEPRNRLYCGT